MTIISSQQELEGKILRAETDITMGKTHTLKEVYEKIEEFRQNKSVCMK